MNKKLSIALILLFVLAAGFFATSCKPQTTEDYYPIGIGSYWEYLVYSKLPQGISKVSKDIYFVSGKELVDDVECYQVDYYTLEGGTPSVGHFREFLAKTEEGVSVTKRSFPLLKESTANWEIRNSPGEIRLKNKMKPGDTWEWKGNVTLKASEVERDENGRPKTTPIFSYIKGESDYEYKGDETITVMGKEMKCKKIFVHETSDDKQELERYAWFAPGIGKVREETVLYQGSTVVQNLIELTGYNITNREIFKKK